MTSMMLMSLQVSNLDVMYSSGKDDWGTPPDLFESLHKEFNFDLDGAANEFNHLLPNWTGPGSPFPDAIIDGSWHYARVFCNPPYSKCKEFVQHATNEVILNRAFVCMLIPARTDTKYWHNFIWDRGLHKPYSYIHQIRFIKGRLKFTVDGKPAENSAPFPSCLILFGDPN